MNPKLTLKKVKKKHKKKPLTDILSCVLSQVSVWDKYFL